MGARTSGLDKRPLHVDTYLPVPNRLVVCRGYLRQYRTCTDQYLMPASTRRHRPCPLQVQGKYTPSIPSVPYHAQEFVRSWLDVHYSLSLPAREEHHRVLFQKENGHPRRCSLFFLIYPPSSPPLSTPPSFHFSFADGSHSYPSHPPSQSRPVLPRCAHSRPPRPGLLASDLGDSQREQGDLGLRTGPSRPFPRPPTPPRARDLSEIIFASEVHIRRGGGGLVPSDCDQLASR